MKRLLDIVIIACLMLCSASCSKDSDEPYGNMIWDIAPTGVIIRLIDEEGNNLLDPETEGNWVGEKMAIGFKDSSFSAIWTYDEYKGYNNNPESRAVMCFFHGLFWTGVIPTGDQKRASLAFGEFDGGSNQEMSLTFMIECINTVLEFKFTHNCEWNNHEPQISNYITYKGNVIKGNVLEIVLPKNQNKGQD